MAVSGNCTINHGITEVDASYLFEHLTPCLQHLSSNNKERKQLVMGTWK